MGRSNAERSGAETPAEPPRAGPVVLVRGAAGAVLGAVAGYLAFTSLFEHGYYVQGVAGTLSGLGCGLLSRRRSWILAGVCVFVALFIGLYCESRVAKWAADLDFAGFLAQAGRIDGSAWLRIGAGGLFGGWFGLGRDPRS